jgi:hypothetical protein
MTGVSLTFTPLYPGAYIETAMLGEIEVGRLSTRGGKFKWMFSLPERNGIASQMWRTAKTRQEAESTLMTLTSVWLQKAGVL